ncbi:MAG TPA: hypothetical protein V6D10_07680 [Trichocoleus sp.]
MSPTHRCASTICLALGTLWERFENGSIATLSSDAGNERHQPLHELRNQP